MVKAARDGEVEGEEETLCSCRVGRLPVVVVVAVWCRKEREAASRCAALARVSVSNVSSCNVVVVMIIVVEGYVI